MAFYEIMPDCLREVPATTFAASGVKERSDLQRLLRAQIKIIAKDTLVVAEEFGDWEGSVRRIDLLAIDNPKDVRPALKRALAEVKKGRLALVDTITQHR